MAATAKVPGHAGSSRPGFSVQPLTSRSESTLLKEDSWQKVQPLAAFMSLSFTNDTWGGPWMLRHNWNKMIYTFQEHIFSNVYTSQGILIEVKSETLNYNHQHLFLP